MHTTTMKADLQGKREKSKADIQRESEIRDKEKINKEKTERDTKRETETEIKSLGFYQLSNSIPRVLWGLDLLPDFTVSSKRYPCIPTK